MEIQKNCSHEWTEAGNKLKCAKCGKTKLKRIIINDELSYGIKDNGKHYFIREDRNMYFYPSQWESFHQSLGDNHKLIFEFLIKTGARIDEALHFKKTGLIDDVRKTIKLYVTKRKARMVGEERGKSRTLPIDPSLYNKLKKEPNLYIFLNINEEIEKEKIKRIAKYRAINLREVMKRKLNIINLDARRYSLHNIRKTHGMWLKTIGVNVNEICLRLGHTVETYQKHYGSADNFNEKDRMGIIKILGKFR